MSDRTCRAVQSSNDRDSVVDIGKKSLLLQRASSSSVHSFTTSGRTRVASSTPKCDSLKIEHRTPNTEHRTRGAAATRFRLLQKPCVYGEFFIRHQRDDHCVMPLFCGDQLRLGPRPTRRRCSPGLETTSELNAITRPPSASRRLCHGLITIWPQFWTLPRLRQSYENNPRTPFLTSHCTVKSYQGVS